jgi:hypothetical protein
LTNKPLVYAVFTSIKIFLCLSIIKQTIKNLVTCISHFYQNIPYHINIFPKKNRKEEERGGGGGENPFREW